MLKMDIKIRDLSTEPTRKTNRSTNIKQTHQLEVPSLSPYSREPIHESSAHDNQNNSQALSAYLIAQCMMHRISASYLRLLLECAAVRTIRVDER